MNTDVVKGIYDAFAKGDVPSVLNSFDPQIEWRKPEGLRYADRNPYVGPQSIVEGVFQRVLAPNGADAAGRLDSTATGPRVRPHR